MTKTNAEEHDYLWDGSGQPDPEVVRLERVLGQLRHQGAAPELPARRSIRSRRRVWLIGTLSSAAAVLLVATLGWYLSLGTGWKLQTVAGSPRVDGVQASGGATTAASRLRVGEWLETDAVSRARIDNEGIGRVDVEPNTRLQVVVARDGEHRMALEKGLIHARIWAPPKRFFVNTPSATAIDLGCEYTLKVDESGAGLIQVTLGWVSFEGGGRESYIPVGAVGATRPGAGPGTPYYEDAPSGYGDALALLDFGAPDDAGRAAALDLILSSARRKDAFTLWHLLSRGSEAERARVYDRLVVLAPPPSGVTREAVLAREQSALDRWWDTLGLESTSWWKLWKTKS